MGIIGLLVGVLLGFILLTIEKAEFIVKVLGIVFLGLIFGTLGLVLFSVNSKKINEQYANYNNSIHKLEEIINGINKDINTCSKIDDNTKTYVLDNIICRNKKYYIKGEVYQNLLLYLKVYFANYGIIHNFKNLEYIIKYIKDKKIDIEKNFLNNNNQTHEKNKKHILTGDKKKIK